MRRPTDVEFADAKFLCVHVSHLPRSSKLKLLSKEVSWRKTTCTAIASVAEFIHLQLVSPAVAACSPTIL